MQKSLKPFPPKFAPGLLGALRSATAPIHQAVEQLPVMMRLTSPAVDPADYRRYLAAMARVYGGLEPGLFAAVAVGLPGEWIALLGLRPKYPALQADLEANGLEVPVLAAAALAPGPECTDLSAALGGLYVLEGATLGGRVIVRQLRGILGSRLVGDAFLDFHRDEGAAVWKGFGSTLEALAADGLVVAGHAITGACAVFDQIYRMLARVDMNDRAEAWTPTPR